MSSSTPKRPSGLTRMGDRARLNIRPIPALVAQLAQRAADGHDPGEVLDGAGIHKPQVRAAYMAAAGLDPEQL